MDKANIKDTHNKPILVHASDSNFYYCKYHGHVGAAHKLFKEFLIGKFLHLWEFNQSQISLVQVMPEHIPSDLGIPKKSFDGPCFGLQIIEDSADLTKINEDILTSSHKKKTLKMDVLKLAFFDIWTCNEDRHMGNYNIIYKIFDGSHVIYPIDHEACFNHGNFENGLSQLTYEDSIIYSSFFSKLFNSSDLKNRKMFSELRKTFYLHSLMCKANIKDILAELPNDWNISIGDKEEEINKYLLNDEWFECCWNNYLNFLQRYIGA